MLAHYYLGCLGQVWGSESTTRGQHLLDEGLLDPRVGEDLWEDLRALLPIPVLGHPPREEAAAYAAALLATLRNKTKTPYVF